MGVDSSSRESLTVDLWAATIPLSGAHRGRSDDFLPPSGPYIKVFAKDGQEFFEILELVRRLGSALVGGVPAAPDARRDHPQGVGGIHVLRGIVADVHGFAR